MTYQEGLSTWADAVRWNPDRGTWEVRGKDGRYVTLNRTGVFILHERAPTLAADATRWPWTWVHVGAP